MATTTQLVTADDLFDMGEDAPYELIRGVLHEVTPTTGMHGWIIVEFARRLGNFVVERRMGRLYGGETGFVIEVGPDTVLAPDLAFVRRDRLPSPKQHSRGFMPVIPDLVIEVLSPSNRRAEFEEKTRLYLSAGVDLLWWFDPIRETVAVHRPHSERQVLTDQDVLVGGNVLPGFQIPVAEIFQPPD
jgi:Uma2 family endonuclease